MRDVGARPGGGIEVFGLTGLIERGDTDGGERSAAARESPMLPVR